MDGSETWMYKARRSSRNQPFEVKVKNPNERCENVTPKEIILEILSPPGVINGDD
jgi:hypothetical protein